MRIAAISDTHEQHRALTIPKCDILVCAGDITNTGSMAAAEDFNSWCGELRRDGVVGEIVLIAGNHDLTAERNPSHWCNIFTDAIYLEHFGEDVCGLNFFGSPWTPKFGVGWAFNATKSQLATLWQQIPDNVDILVTHGPPKGCQDMTDRGVAAGCEDLRLAINRTKPILHICGHIHEGYGVGRVHETVVMNASSCNLQYKPVNAPLVFEI